MPNPFTKEWLAEYKAKRPELYPEQAKVQGKLCLFCMQNPCVSPKICGPVQKGLKKKPQPEQEGSAMDSMRVKSEPKKRNQPESDMQISLFDMIYLHETKYPLLKRVWHSPNGGYRSADPGARAKRQKLVRMGMRAGVFDIHVDVVKYKTVENRAGYYQKTEFHGLKIELKAPGGKMSDAQTDWLNYYREAGYRAEICFSWEEAWNIICDYLGYEEIKV